MGQPEQLRQVISFDGLSVKEREQVMLEANRLGLSTSYGKTLEGWAVSLAATPAEQATLEALFGKREREE